MVFGEKDAACKGCNQLWELGKFGWLTQEEVNRRAAVKKSGYKRKKR